MKFHHMLCDEPEASTACDCAEAHPLTSGVEKVVLLQPGRMSRQLADASAEVAAWPESMRVAHGIAAQTDTPDGERAAFLAFLEANRKVVESWPQWKRDAARTVFADCHRHVCNATCARRGCTE